MAENRQRCEYASFHAYNLRVNLKTHNREHLYKCKHCDFALSGPSTLRRLLETNSGQKTNNQCKYALYQTGNLRTHMKTHSGEKQNQCKQFDYISSGPSTLRTHLKRHSEVKSNKCNQCNFSSTWPTNLRTHLKMHSGEKLIRCNLFIMHPLEQAT